MLSIIIEAHRDDNMEAWAFLSMPFVMVSFGLLITAYIGLYVIGRKLADERERMGLLPLSQVISNIIKKPQMKLKDPMNFMKGKK